MTDKPDKSLQAKHRQAQKNPGNARIALIDFFLKSLKVFALDISGCRNPFEWLST